MYDLNFLEAPSDKKKRSVGVPILIALAVFVALLAGALYTIIQIKSIGLQTVIAAERAYIDSEEVYLKQQELQKIQQKEQILQEYKEKVSTLDTYLTAVNIADSIAFKAIEEAAPPDVAYTNVSISGYNLSLETVVPDSMAAAQLLHNLSSLDEIESAEITNISYDDSYKGGKATVQCTLKDVILR